MTFNRLQSFESLESRRLLSASVRSGDTLRISGDSGVDNVITLAPTADGDSVVVTINGEVETVSLNKVKKVRIAGSSGRDEIRVDETNHLFEVFTSIETFGGNDFVVCGSEKDYVYAGDGNDTVRVGNGRNKAFGEAGNDHLTGGEDRDLLVGGAGNDQIEGGDARDEITGDKGNDVLYGGDAADLIMGGGGNDLIFGEAGRDVLVGQDGNDTLSGGSDSDELFGNAGDDNLDGGPDRDTLWGGDGNDVLTTGGGGGKTHSGEFDGIEIFLREIRPAI